MEEAVSLYFTILLHLPAVYSSLVRNELLAVEAAQHRTGKIEKKKREKRYMITFLSIRSNIL